jgi:hypothetical protein
VNTEKTSLAIPLVFAILNTVYKIMLLTQRKDIGKQYFILEGYSDYPKYFGSKLAMGAHPLTLFFYLPYDFPAYPTRLANPFFEEGI